MITVTFACGHHETASSGDSVPVCGICGERRVSHVKAPAPTFRGAVRGPMATYTNPDPITVNVAPGGPLALK